MENRKRVDFINVRKMFFFNKKFPVRVVITLDYETWQPISNGYVINWDKDIFESTDVWLGIAAKFGIKLTFFVDMGFYYWLKVHEAAVAYRMEQQIEQIVFQNHDIQLHLHPSWLPEFGVTYEHGKWIGLDQNQKLHTVPLDIFSLLMKSKIDLETMAQNIKKDYKVTTFRAAAFQIQPSKEIVDALLRAGLKADSSVCKGGFDSALETDFRTACHEHQPYFADADDINKQAVSKDAILEIPIFSWTEHYYRWSFDNQNAQQMFSPLKLILSEYGYAVPVSLKRKIRLFFSKKRAVSSHKPLIFTAIAHTKIPVDQYELEVFFKELSSYSFIESCTMNDVVALYTHE